MTQDIPITDPNILVRGLNISNTGGVSNVGKSNFHPLSCQKPGREHGSQPYQTTVRCLLQK